MSRPKVIVITGPESTGKSLLTQRLALEFRTSWSPEFARSYLEIHGPSYQFEDLRPIAEGQISVQNLATEKANEVVFMDTDLLTIKIWSEFVFGKLDPWILEQWSRSIVDHYLLCDIDLPWQPDPLREHPQQREELFGIYHSNIRESGTPYSIIRGLEEERFSNAMKVLKDLGHSPSSRSSS